MSSSGYVVRAGTLSLIHADWHGKGRSGLRWWLVSLLLGPLATLLIVLLPDLRTVRIPIANSHVGDGWVGRPLTSDDPST